MSIMETVGPAYDKGFEDGFADGLGEGVAVVAAVRALLRTRGPDAEADPAFERIRRAVAKWDEANAGLDPD